MLPAGSIAVWRGLPPVVLLSLQSGGSYELPLDHADTVAGCGQFANLREGLAEGCDGVVDLGAGTVDEGERLNSAAGLMRWGSSPSSAFWSA